MRYNSFLVVMLLVLVGLVEGDVKLDDSRLDQSRDVQGTSSPQLNTVRRVTDALKYTVDDRVFSDISFGDSGGDRVFGGRFRRSLDTSKTAGYDWNQVVDVIFSFTQREILVQGKDKIHLPDAVNEFEKKYGFLKVKGTFSAKDGTLSNMTDFRRLGDVSVIKKNEIFEMICVLSLDNLKMTYESYELKVLGLRLRGTLEGTVTSATVRVTLNFARTDEGCLSTVEEVALTELQGLKVTVSGLGNYNGLGSALATWIVEQREKDIVSIINRELKREIKKALEEFQCDEYATLVL